MEQMNVRLGRLNEVLQNYRKATEHVRAFWDNRHVTYDLRGSGETEAIYIYKGGLVPGTGKELLTVEASENKAIAYIQKWYGAQIEPWNALCKLTDDGSGSTGSGNSGDPEDEDELWDRDDYWGMWGY